MEDFPRCCLHFVGKYRIPVYWPVEEGRQTLKATFWVIHRMPKDTFFPVLVLATIS